MKHIAGVDEVGRGCLAGPVIASAVILKKHIPGLKDSKKLSPPQRNKLSALIIQNSFYSIGSASEQEIDEINILNASILAMHRALDKLDTKPEFILIDGNQFKQYKKLRHECIIKGDNKYQNIAAASILAKNYRDKLMQDLSSRFDKYSWETNFGYPTKKHRDSIKKYGVTEYHRKSFKLL